MLAISRILAAVIAVLALFGSGKHWYNLDAVFVQRGVQAVGDVGRANLRADGGGLFWEIACFALLVAARQN